MGAADAVVPERAVNADGRGVRAGVGAGGIGADETTFDGAARSVEGEEEGLVEAIDDQPANRHVRGSRAEALRGVGGGHFNEQHRVVAGRESVGRRARL